MIERPAFRATDLTVQQMRMFCQVYDCGSYAEAARQLVMTPPTLWTQVHLLERRYRVTLFQKVGRRLASTPDAQRLREAFRPILAGLESTFDVVGPSAHGVPQTIGLVTGMRMALEELSIPVAAFRQRHPEISIHWTHADNLRAQELIDSGHADLAVMLEPMPDRRSSRLEFAPAYRIEYLAIFPPDHPLANKKRLRLNQLAAELLIIGHPGTFVRQALESALHQRNFTPRLRVVVETDNSAVTIACVRQGMGIGIIAGRETGPLLLGLAVRSLRGTMGEARIVAAWKRGTILSDAVQELIEAIGTA